ncbi:pyruvate, phosphate dikinase [mine drainage metagenome]|uniref:Pyruvate, phosphate dikinase n=1 Tax=mine drainage metagenome TaxID=410659 RepID=A0A1J5RV97_9ZZZZ
MSKFPRMKPHSMSPAPLHHLAAADHTAADAAALHTIGCGAAPAALPTPEWVGSKAYNLMRMAALGLPVPPAFVLDTHWCARPEELTAAIWQPALHALERASGLRFGDARHPLLLSVRSGAPVSMPGMLETLLNIGLCDTTVPGLLRLTGNPRLVWDAYRRLVAGYGEIVSGIAAQAFSADLQAVAASRDERELDFAELRDITHRHLATHARESGQPFPQDPVDQLGAAIHAVFSSWHADKARTYRRIKGLDDAMGTAVTVQRMVFGNAGGVSGAGVGFTRNPSSGEPSPWVDFLFNAQGEDVVSGRRSARGHEAMAAVAPAVWRLLVDVARRLETEFRDMQDFEFTVEQGQLFLLQTRDGKRTPQAAARIALDLLDRGLISPDEALRRTQGLDHHALELTTLLAPDGALPPPLARADSASSGVAVGVIALDEMSARTQHAAGRAVLLLRQDAETSDLAALDHAVGLLTQRGARTSHAAVVARQLGKVCLVGCDVLHIDVSHRTVILGGQTFGEGDMLTLDGNSGSVYAGALQVSRQVPPDLLARLAALRGHPVAAQGQSGGRKA